LVCVVAEFGGAGDGGSSASRAMGFSDRDARTTSRPGGGYRGGAARGFDRF